MAEAPTEKPSEPAPDLQPAAIAWMKALGWMFRGAGFAVQESETRDDQYTRWKDQTGRMEQFRRRDRTDTSREAWDKTLRGAFPAAAAKTPFSGIDTAQTRAIAIQTPLFEEGASKRQELRALAEIRRTPPEDTTPFLYKGAGLTVSVSFDGVSPTITLIETPAYTNTRLITADQPEPAWKSFTGAHDRPVTTVFPWEDRLKAQDQITGWIEAHTKPLPPAAEKKPASKPAEPPRTAIPVPAAPVTDKAPPPPKP